MSPIPLIVIGKNAKNASKVSEGLLPEYEVIHIITSVEQGVKDLPLLLADPVQTPPDNEENAGSRNYSARPLAVGVGGGYNDATFQEMKDACKGVEQGIFWLKANPANLDQMPSPADIDAFSTEIATRVKNKLNELNVGKKDAKEPGVYYFL